MKNTCSTNWKHHLRNNLTLRTRIKRLARKTICFSRSVEIHEKVIGTFIEKQHVLLIGSITLWSIVLIL
ncbi:Transposase [Shigella dysenteriae 1617]|uniref:Transposase n=1 Tax=Shigella dysenteriae 1617 TaxID=754093 RepID=A0A0A6ZZ53_SHIDY|nr:Transposase [Shigella dysenteriae 1617]